MKTLFNKSCELCPYHNREENPNATIILHMCKHPKFGSDGKQILSYPSNIGCPFTALRSHDPVLAISADQYKELWKGLKIRGDAVENVIQRSHIEWNLSRNYLDSALEFREASFVAFKFDLIAYVNAVRLDNYSKERHDEFVGKDGIVIKPLVSCGVPDAYLGGLKPNRICTLAYCIEDSQPAKATLIRIQDADVQRLRSLESTFEYCGLTVHRSQIKYVYELHVK